MSKFTPIDEKQYQERNVWPAGYYDATVLNSTERLSSNGNLMFETKWEVYNDAGSKRIITSYILAEGKAAFQLREAAEALGILDKYRDASLTEDDLKGRSCFVKIGIEKVGSYAGSNKIIGYRSSKPGTIKASEIHKPNPQTKKETEKDLGDNIPF